jgi:hypothetical protein
LRKSPAEKADLEAVEAPLRLASSARAASTPSGPAARATSSTMSLGGEIAKECSCFSFAIGIIAD